MAGYRRRVRTSNVRRRRRVYRKKTMAQKSMIQSAKSSFASGLGRTLGQAAGAVAGGVVGGIIGGPGMSVTGASIGSGLASAIGNIGAVPAHYEENIFDPDGQPLAVGARPGYLERAMNFITGRGDYKVSRNSLISLSSDVPQFANVANARQTHVTHKEFIQDIISSSTPGQFKLDVFPINPGLGKTFPWLSSLAINFEEYAMDGLVFEFKSTSSNALNSTNTALGTVIMATQYNSLNPNFVNKQQMENYEFACSANPSCSFLHPIECAKFLNPTDILYVREDESSVSSTSDKRLYDMGNFSIASVGLQGTSVNIGELWVTYSLRLLKPKLGQATDVMDHFILNAASIATGSYLGNVALTSPSSTSDFGVQLTQTTILIPPWFYGNICVVYTITGNSASQTAPTFTGSVGCSPLLIMNNDTANYYITPISETVATIQHVSFWTCVGGGTITIASGSIGSAGSVTSGDLYVMTISSNMTN